MRRGGRGGRGRGNALARASPSRPEPPTGSGPPELEVLTAEQVIARLQEAADARVLSEVNEESQLPENVVDAGTGELRRLRLQVEDDQETIEYLRGLCDQAQQEISELVSENADLRDERDDLNQQVSELDGVARDLRRQNRSLQRGLNEAERHTAILQRDLQQYYHDREHAERSRRHQKAAAAAAIAENHDPELTAARQMFRDAREEWDRQARVLHREIRLLRDWRNVALDEIMEFWQRQQRERASYRRVLEQHAEPGASQALTDCLRERERLDAQLRDYEYMVASAEDQARYNLWLWHWDRVMRGDAEEAPHVNEEVELPQPYHDSRTEDLAEDRHQ
ncbi:hypothetical protein K488DRAFT_92805, partial [Vararia minispora EC-137]